MKRFATFIVITLVGITFAVQASGEELILSAMSIRDGVQAGWLETARPVTNFRPATDTEVTRDSRKPAAESERDTPKGISSENAAAMGHNQLIGGLPKFSSVFSLQADDCFSDCSIASHRAKVSNDVLDMVE